MSKNISTIPCDRVNNGLFTRHVDHVAEEALLTIDIIAGPRHNRIAHNFTSLLRTPGHDRELALGLFYALGLIKKAEEILNLDHCLRPKIDSNATAKLTIELAYDKSFMPLDYTSAHARYSSCGFCGNSMPKLEPSLDEPKNLIVINANFLLAALAKLAREQKNFAKTGGTHGAALFSLSGTLLALYEDVGRHNALDKLIGHFLLKQELPLNEQVLIMTSRASYEIIQKAAMANVSIVATMGAVSSLAIDYAQKHHLTLIGFLRDERFTIYTHPERMARHSYEAI